MTDRQPVDVVNLDQYGNAALEWSRVHDQLYAASATTDVTWFLGTTRPDGRPHATGVDAIWLDGDFYVVSGPETRKSRNLEANPACTISAKMPGIDVVFEGDAARARDTSSRYVSRSLCAALRSSW